MSSGSNSTSCVAAILGDLSKSATNFGQCLGCSIKSAHEPMASSICRISIKAFHARANSFSPQIQIARTGPTTSTAKAQQTSIAPTSLEYIIGKQYLNSLTPDPLPVREGN